MTISRLSLAAWPQELAADEAGAAEGAFRTDDAGEAGGEADVA
jgi:hypothetical protein